MPGADLRRVRETRDQRVALFRCRRVILPEIQRSEVSRTVVRVTDNGRIIRLRGVGAGLAAGDEKAQREQERRERE